MPPQGPVIVELDKRQLKQIEDTLSDFPKEAPKLWARALNRAAKTMSSRIVRPVAKALKLKQKIVRKRVWVTTAKGNRLQVRLRGGKIGWPLIEMKAKATRKGVSVRLPGMKKREILRHAFIATMPSGHEGVYVRKERWSHKSPEGHGLPIRELRGPSVTEIVDGLGLLPEIVREGQGVLLKRMSHETVRLLKRKGAVAG